MPFDWTKFLELTRFLQSYSGSEIDEETAYRCAVSRAYYAAFCYARNYAEANLGFVRSKTREDHVRVRKVLTLQGKRKMTDSAAKLDRLGRWRGQCDYDDSVLNLPTILKSAIEEAQSVLSNLKT